MAAEDRQTTQAADPVSKRTLSLLVEVLADCRPRDFAIRLWDGTGWEAETGQPTRFTLVLNHPGALRAMLSSLSDVGLAEAYIYQDIDIEGDLEQALGILPDAQVRGVVVSRVSRCGGGTEQDGETGDQSENAVIHGILDAINGTCRAVVERTGRWRGHRRPRTDRPTRPS